MIKAGASGYVLKDNSFKELNTAIKAVLKNKTFISPQLSHIDLEGAPAASEEDQKTSLLNDRELKVLQLLAEGNSTKEIALHFDRSSKTIDACRRQIMIKLNLESQAELIKYAIREGLTTVDA
jgi:DNA-binding NarL/FixJ family response regulator